MFGCKYTGPDHDLEAHPVSCPYSRPKAIIDLWDIVKKHMRLNPGFKPNLWETLSLSAYRFSGVRPHTETTTGKSEPVLFDSGAIWQGQAPGERKLATQFLKAAPPPPADAVTILAQLH